MMERSGSQSQNSKKRKRKGRKQGTSWTQEQEKYYERLLHGAQKDLRKQAKVVRTFECQKLIRRLKESQKNAPESEKEIPEKKQKSAEQHYEQLKHLNLDFVIQESFRRLGILHLDPKLQRETTVNDADTTEEDDGQSDPPSSTEANDNREGTSSPDQNTESGGDATEKKLEAVVPIPKEQLTRLVEKILNHKKMQTTLETWNEQVTEYRRWCLQKQEQETRPRFSEGSLSYDRAGSKKKKQKKSARTVDRSENLDKSLFLRLGDGCDDYGDNDDGDTMPHYGPGSMMVEETKKNRPGQRARKAKAMAIEAKKMGKSHRAADSVNWRPKKQQQNEDNGQSVAGSRANRASERHRDNAPAQVKQHGAPAPANEELHPSWAAAKKETVGIVQFQGKKITFD